MRFGFLRVITLLTLFTFLMSAQALAAVTGVRFHSGSQHDRIVFDLDEPGHYETRLSKDGRELTVVLPPATHGAFHKDSLKGQRIGAVRFSAAAKNLTVRIRLDPGMTYRASAVQNPSRIFIDVTEARHAAKTRPVYDHKKPAKTVQKPAKGPKATTGKSGDNAYTETVAPGLELTSYIYWDDKGKVSAWVLKADRSRYRLALALSNGKVPGTETVSRTSDRTDAVAAINASYFAGNGDILGVTRIDGKMAGATWYRRSAIGIKSDGSTQFGTIGYDGKVKLGSISQDIGGVDCERGADMLVVYNSHYGARTGTNEYGMEYTVEDGHVTAVRQSNSPIPRGGYVVSVHGTAAEAFRDVVVGDPAEIRQDIGAEWEAIPTIVGVGPRLVENGRVHVTVAAEEFPGDIRYGRAPRSAVGVTRSGDYILAVVDGRQASSVGLTLTDWATFLRAHGAYNAINLDGGGSSELVVGGKIENSPSDGHERSVGSSLILTSK